MTTPFDTTRLDEECERIARENKWARPNHFAPHAWLGASYVRGILLDLDGKDPTMSKDSWTAYVRETLRLCRRPKMVKAREYLGSLRSAGHASNSASRRIGGAFA